MFVPTILTALGLACLSGCASRHEKFDANGAPVRRERFYMVTSEAAAFYLHSPKQASGPDQMLTRDTPVTIIRYSFGFCKVKLVDGKKGFVASDNLAPATGKLVAAADTNSSPKPAELVSAAYRAEMPQPRPAPSQPPLPEFEPTPIPSPAPAN
jgi:hypothetical protein